MLGGFNNCYVFCMFEVILSDWTNCACCGCGVRLEEEQQDGQQSAAGEGEDGAASSAVQEAHSSDETKPEPMESDEMEVDLRVSDDEAAPKPAPTNEGESVDETK